MRVSQLLRREPFGLIVEDTLSLYWSNLIGRDVRVSWGKCLHGQYLWIGNSYLNFFCISNVDSDCFENIINEYSFSCVWWRRGLQSAYVRAAVTSPIRSLLSDTCFSVSEPIPNANQQLVLGGRNRLRIVHPQASESTVIAKAGFPRLGFDREVAVRRGLAHSIAPRFFGLKSDGMAFSEEYFVGTPANRLPVRLAKCVRLSATQMLVNSVHRPSLCSVSFVDYLQQLVETIFRFSSVAGQQARPIADWVDLRCGSSILGISMTHGDFQNANILFSNDSIKIIDWETATLRSQFYDHATLSSGIRLASDRFEVWRTSVENWLLHPEQIPDLLVPIKNRTSLLFSSLVWWLEELIFQLEEVHFGSKASLFILNDKVECNSSKIIQFVDSIYC